MTEVGRWAGGWVERFMAGRLSIAVTRGLQAGWCCWPEGDSGTGKDSGAKLRETVTALPAPVTLESVMRFSRGLRRNSALA
jgi:hypothetical protein